MLWTKRAHQSTISQTLGALMKVHSIPHAIFETRRSRSIQILHHCSVLWKITPLSFCGDILWTKKAHRKDLKFLDLVGGWWKFNKFVMSYLKNMSQFLVKLCITLQCYQKWLFCSYFSLNFIWFGQKEPIKVQNFRLLTGHVKIREIRTLIGSFYWNYIKFHLKKV